MYMRKATFGDFYKLAKPGIIYGNIFTTLAGFLSGLRGSRVEVRAPERGEKRRLQELAQRNAALALSSEAARRCHGRLTAAGVIGDWREPDTLRFAPIALYNSFRDVAAAVDALAAAVKA